MSCTPRVYLNKTRPWKSYCVETRAPYFINKYCVGVGLFVFQFLVLISVFGIFVAWDQKVERTNMLRMGREKGLAVSSDALGIETNTCNDYIYIYIFCHILLWHRHVLARHGWYYDASIKYSTEVSYTICQWTDNHATGIPSVTLIFGKE